MDLQVALVTQVAQVLLRCSANMSDNPERIVIQTLDDFAELFVRFFGQYVDQLDQTLLMPLDGSISYTDAELHNVEMPMDGEQFSVGFLAGIRAAKSMLGPLPFQQVEAEEPPALPDETNGTD